MCKYGNQYEQCKFLGKCALFLGRQLPKNNAQIFKFNLQKIKNFESKKEEKISRIEEKIFFSV